MSDFLKVEVYSNWGYWDRLDGENLVDGEKVIVRWPDGREGPKTVSVERTVELGNDMSHVIEVPSERAYITASVHGATVRLRLADADVLVKRA